MTNLHAGSHSDYRLLIGILTGAVLGAGAAIFFGPRMASELRRATGSAKKLGNQTAARYQEASTRVGETIDDVTAQGRQLRDDLTAQGKGLRDDVLKAVTRS